MNVDEIRAALKPYNLKRVAELTGLSHTSVWRFASGKTTKPTWAMVSTLEAFLTGGK